MNDRSNRPRRHSHYDMDFIPDRILFKAVMFARRMMREGVPPPLANYKAARYWRVRVRDVAHYTGQVGASCARRRRRRYR